MNKKTKLVLASLKIYYYFKFKLTDLDGDILVTREMLTHSLNRKKYHYLIYNYYHV